MGLAVSLAPQIGQCAKDRVEHNVQMLTEVRGEKTQYEMPVRLQRRILATVAPPGGLVAQVLVAINFDDQSRRRIQQIHLHFAVLVKGDWQPGVEPEYAGEVRQRF